MITKESVVRTVEHMLKQSDAIGPAYIGMSKDISGYVLTYSYHSEEVPKPHSKNAVMDTHKFGIKEFAKDSVTGDISEIVSCVEEAISTLKESYEVNLSVDPDLNYYNSLINQ